MYNNNTTSTPSIQNQYISLLKPTTRIRHFRVDMFPPLLSVNFSVYSLMSLLGAEKKTARRWRENQTPTCCHCPLPLLFEGMCTVCCHWSTYILQHMLPSFTTPPSTPTFLLHWAQINWMVYSCASHTLSRNLQTLILTWNLYHSSENSEIYKLCSMRTD